MFFLFKESPTFFQKRKLGFFFKEQTGVFHQRTTPGFFFNDVFSFRKKELNEEINLVITSNFRPHKRLFDAILLINRLKNKVPKIRLKVVGKIDSITLKAIQNLDLSNCDFLGTIPSDRIPQVYKNCVLGLSPAIFDPCPNSVVEMMACGLPVISCEESGASELIGVSDLCVKENLELKYYEFQTIERLPKINLKSLCGKVSFDAESTYLTWLKTSSDTPFEPPIINSTCLNSNDKSWIIFESCLLETCLPCKSHKMVAFFFSKALINKFASFSILYA